MPPDKSSDEHGTFSFFIRVNIKVAYKFSIYHEYI